MAHRLTRRRSEAAALPEWVAPQLTQLADAAPEGDGWLHEIKHDSYRMHARLDRGTVKLLIRTGLDSRFICRLTRGRQPGHVRSALAGYVAA